MRGNHICNAKETKTPLPRAAAADLGSGTHMHEFAKQVGEIADRLEEETLALERGDAASFQDLREITGALRELYTKTQKLEREARTDHLTGLLNRRAFLDELKREVASVKRSTAKGIARPLHMVFIDLDHFKPINDTYGHDIGDLYLKIISEHMRKVLMREGDLIARMGGDEFVVLLSDADAHGAEIVSRNILSAVRTASDLAKQELRKKSEESIIDTDANVTASIGYALFDGKEEPETLLHRADYAAYAVKTSGRCNALSYESALALDADGAMQKEFSGSV